MPEWSTLDYTDQIKKAEDRVVNAQEDVDQRTADKQNFFDPERREYAELSKRLSSGEKLSDEENARLDYLFDSQGDDGRFSAETVADLRNLNRTNTAGDVADATQGVRDGAKASQQVAVTTINAPTTNASNTNVKSVNPTPRDTDPTGSRLAAVPA